MAESQQHEPTPPLILVADDDPAVRLLARDFLEDAGFQVEEAKDGADAVALFARQRPSLVLLDVAMPRKDGLAACKEMQGLPGGDRTPVIIVTGRDDVDSVRRALEVGATDFVTKPINWIVLIQRLQYVLRASETTERLRESEARHAAFLNAIPDMMLDVQGDGTVRNSKPALGDDPLLTSGEQFGKNIADLWPRELAIRTRQSMIDASATGRPQLFEHRLDHDDVVRDYELRTVSTDDGGAVVIIRNITAKKQLEQRLQQSEKLEALGALAGGIAHDFNNVLTVVNGYAELLQLQAGNGSDLRRVQTILGAAQHGAALTHQLLAFARKQPIAPRVLALNEIVARTRKMLDRIIGEDVQLVTRLEAGLRPVYIDAGRADQILMNLAVNARDAMPTGGTLTVSTTTTDHLPSRISAPADPDASTQWILLSVSDTGEGISLEARDRIFEPFFTSKADGTGLGLATVYGVVTQAGGHITVSSDQGKGTTFDIYLPAAHTDETSENKVSDDEVRGGTETILVVEDEQSVRDLVCEVLTQRGYRLLSAPDAHGALSIARQHDGPIHLLVTDVVMPAMSGRGLADQLIALHRDVKVLYISGHMDDLVRRHGVSVPATAFIQKPFTSQSLVGRVRSVLDSSLVDCKAVA